MKYIITIALFLSPLWAMGQSAKLTEAQSKQRIEKLAKLLKQYDARYDYFNFIDDCDFAIFTDSNDYQQGIVDLDGRVLLPSKYQIFRQQGSSLFLVIGDSTLGLVDKDMRWRLPMEYDHSIECLECKDMGNYFPDGYACLQKNWQYGVIDTSGKVLIPFKFDQPFGVDFINKMLYFYDDEDGTLTARITDFDGKKLIGPYNWINRFKEGVAGFEKNDKYGYLDTKGNIVIPAKYEYTGWNFEKGLTLVTQDEKQLIIDKKGKVKHVFSNSYDVMKPLWEYSTFVVKKYHNIEFNLEGYYGVVDITGKQLVPISYDMCCIVNDKYFAMSKEESLCDIYDRSGSLVASFHLMKDVIDYDEEVGTYSCDHFVVMKDSLWGIADSNFKIVLPCRYNDLTYLGHGIAKVVNPDESASVIDLTGKVLVEGPYQDIKLVSDQLFKFYTFNPDKYEEMIVGFVDIYGNSTATKEQIAKMQSWMKRN